MKISANFDVRELVPPETWATYKERSVKFTDQRIVNLLEAIRTLCGNKRVTANNWHYGGKFRYRGYRPPECKVGAVKSMHRVFQAVDFDVEDMTAEEVRGVIRMNQVELMKLGLRRMESGVSWVHIDTKETGLTTIKEFKP